MLVFRVSAGWCFWSNFRRPRMVVVVELAGINRTSSCSRSFAFMRLRIKPVPRDRLFLSRGEEPWSRGGPVSDFAVPRIHDC